MDNFIAAPIMLHHSSSLLTNDKAVSMYPVAQSHYHHEADEATNDVSIDVPQNLEPEQYQYEFPPKSRLEALAHLYDNDDTEDGHSFFDESSFTTNSTSSFTSIHGDRASQSRISHASSSRSSYNIHTTTHLDRFHSAANPGHSGFHASSWYHQQHHHDMSTDDDSSQGSAEENFLVEDSQLSPLQLPAPSRRPGSSQQRSREPSCDSIDTITQCKITQQRDYAKAATPSSFLSISHSLIHPLDHTALEVDLPDYAHRHLSPRPLSSRNSDQSLPVFESESELHMVYNDDDSSSGSSDSKVVLMKLSRSARHAPVIVASRCATRYAWSRSDEGYDDQVDDDKEPPIPSVSTFHDLSDQEKEHLIQTDILRNAAAVTIQAAWRGYQTRKALASGPLKPAQRLVVDIVRMCANVHRQNMHRMDGRVQELERQLREETAMRIAFEKAMEDMTILVDKQQKMLNDRLEQEISMRQVYEQQMKDTMAQMKPLAARLQKETKARSELESMMKRVLDQVQEVKATAQKQAKEEAASKKALQRKLDDALAEMASLKRQLEKSTPPARSPAPARPSSSRLSTATTLTSSSSRLSSTPSSRPQSRLTTLSSSAGSVGRQVTRPGTKTPVTKRRT